MSTYSREQLKKGKIVSGVLQPFTDLTEALAQSAERDRFDEKYVLVEGVPTVYWYRDGILNSHLIPKAGASVTFEGVLSVNGVEPDIDGNVELDIPETFVLTVNGSPPDEDGNINVAIDGSTVVNVQDYGVLPDGNPHDTEWAAAKAAGDVMYFPKGTYMSGPNGWRVYRDNITIYGDGMGSTVLTTPEPSDATGFELSGYRRVGWDTNNPIPYTNELELGQKWVDVINSTVAALLTAGDKIFITAGASYYDQEYGEFNYVEAIAGTRVYLRYNLSRDYTYERSNWNGELLGTFTVPASVGLTSTVSIQNPPSVGNKYVSLDNDLYEVTASGGGNPANITLKRLFAEGVTTSFPPGTRVFKGRAIYKTPQSSSNVFVRDLTVIGHRKALSVSNSMNTRFERCEFKWLPGSTSGGLWLDGDDGLNAHFIGCRFSCPTTFESQPARSFKGMRFDGCHFNQATMNFSEFNSYCEVTNCTFDISSVSGGKNDRPPISVGWTTSNMKVHGNTINVEGVNYAISMFPDVNGFKNIHRGSISIKDNVINAKDVSTVIACSPGAGATEVSGNKIFGSCTYLFSVDQRPIDEMGTTTTDNVEAYVTGSHLHIHHNMVQAKFDGVLGSRIRNCVFTDNYIHQQEEYTEGGNSSIRSNGNIIRNTGGDDSANPIEIVQFKDNTFKHMYYTNGSMNYQNVLNEKVNISNNLFIDNVGPGNSGTPLFILNTYIP